MIYGGKSIPMIALRSHHSIIMDDFLIPETPQPIVVVSQSSYCLKFLLELWNTLQPEQLLAPL